MRGRDQLRDRLIRRGIVLSSGGLIAALTGEPASALQSDLVAATARAIADGTGFSTSVQHLTQGVLRIMTRTRLWPTAAVAIALAASVVWTFAASPDPPPAAKEKAEEKTREKPPEERPVLISPGIQALVALSTDIVVADVVETHPRRAIEGARDNVKLKVIRNLLGRAKEGETISVYYHLLWADDKGEAGGNLEAPKFAKDKRYVIFLNSHDGQERIEYELTDCWLSVLSDHIELLKEVIAAVRVSHGDARGEWSSTDGSEARLQGRLVVYREKAASGDTPIITVYLDLRAWPTEFLLDGAKASWTVTDGDGKGVEPINPPGSWKTTSTPRMLRLAGKETGRLQLTISGGGITQNRAGHLELASDRVWEFEKGDKKTYSLGGKIEIKPSEKLGKQNQWNGTLKLPKVRLPLGE
jgi:hypothetical protein